MKYRFPIFVLLSALTLMTLAAGATFGHHSAAATYIHGKSVKIEGTLKEFIWRNPHSFMKVQAPDEKGESVRARTRSVACSLVSSRAAA